MPCQNNHLLSRDSRRWKGKRLHPFWLVLLARLAYHSQQQVVMHMQEAGLLVPWWLQKASDMGG